MKPILTALLILQALVLMAQNKEVTDSLANEVPIETLVLDSNDVFDTTHIELLRMFPEPFYDFLQFDFLVHDNNEHEVKIYIVNSQNELVYFQQVQVYTGHENIRINTIDFFMNGLYSIQIKIDKEYHYLRTFKRTRY